MISILLLASMAFYVYFAVDLFSKDKSAYIYEDSLKSNESLATIISTKIESAQRTLLMVRAATNKSAVFNTVPSFLSYKEYKIEKKSIIPIAELFNSETPQSYGFLTGHIEEVEKRFPPPLQKIVLENITAIPIISSEVIPHFLISRVSPNKKELITARVLANDLIDALRKNTNYYSYVITTDGAPFLNITANTITPRLPHLKKIIGSGRSGVIDSTGKKMGTSLISYSPLNGMGLVVVSEILKARAFKATEYLVTKSQFFGVFLISIAVIIGILFARGVTTDIDKLVLATDQVRKKNFTTSVAIKSRDEIGALSDSFNIMSKEILNYMKEMKEKARLENELEVAKLVQESFFPDHHTSNDEVQLSAFYAPASECGGDWWSYLDHNGKLILFVADATGHGVPAAFLTATANCCATNIKYLANTNPEIINSPSKILTFMNNAICSVGERIHMTAFVGVIDKETGVMKYSNASHNSPFMVQNLGKEAMNKSDLIPILGNIGPRLGHKKDAAYDEGQVQLEEKTSLILFTDGILENTNTELNAYGQRKFINSIVDRLCPDAKTSVESIIRDANTFCDGHAYDDDVTLVVCNYKMGRPEIDIKSYPEDIAAQINSSFKHNPHSETKLIDAMEFLSTPEKFSQDSDKLIIISEKSDEENVLNIMEKYPVKHIIGANSKHIKDEIIDATSPKGNTSEKSLIGTLYYKEAAITSTEQIDSVIECLMDGIKFDEIFDSPIEYLKTMANELLTNAFFNSSTEQTTDRTTEISLSEKEVTCKIGVNKDQITLSVSDQYGTFTIDRLRKSLAYGFRNKTPKTGAGGAGIGLYMCYSFSNQLIVNLTPSKKTEIICIIEKNRRYKTYKERITSMHFNELETS